MRHQNNLAVIIGISSCLSLLIDRDRAFTLNQYEQNLRDSIDVLITNLDQQREQAQAKEGEQQHRAEPEPEQLEQAQPELELFQDTIIDDVEIIDDPKIETKLSVNQNLFRSSRSNWNR